MEGRKQDRSAPRCYRMLDGWEEEPEAGEGRSMTNQSETERLPDAMQIGVAAVGTLLIGVLYLVLPDALTIGPNWLLLTVEAVLLVPVVVAVAFQRRVLPYRIARGFALGLLVVVTAAL